MKSLDDKIMTLENMLADPDKLNKALYEIISAGDMNNDDQLSRAEFQKVLQDFKVGDFDAVDDLFTSLDRDMNGYINFKEFRHFFRAQMRIKLGHLKELKAVKQKAKSKSKAPAEEQSSSSSEEEPKKKFGLGFKKWKSTRN